MNNQYLPDLGQMAFGQPWQTYECPEFVVAALEALQEILDERQGIDPFSNSGSSFGNDTFQVEAYSWSDDEQPWNFKWKDIEVSWYKWLGRGTTINKPYVSKDLIASMLLECIDSIEEGP